MTSLISVYLLVVHLGHSAATLWIKNQHVPCFFSQCLQSRDEYRLLLFYCSSFFTRLFDTCHLFCNQRTALTCFFLVQQGLHLSLPTRSAYEADSASRQKPLRHADQVLGQCQWPYNTLPNCNLLFSIRKVWDKRGLIEVSSLSSLFLSLPFQPVFLLFNVI